MMESIAVHLKNKPSESIRIESMPASEALNRLGSEVLTEL